jgi:hypothetical protein
MTRTHAAACPVQYSAGYACDCDYSRAAPIGPNLYREMLAARAHMSDCEQRAARNVCADGDCSAEQSGAGCDTLALLAEWQEEYHRAREAWHAAGRPE